MSVKIRQQAIERSSAAARQHADVVASVNNDPRLTEEGRRQKLAAAWVARKAIVDEARALYDAELQSERDQLVSRVFGAGETSDKDAWWKAQERVDQADEQGKLPALLERAILAGDQTTGLAVAARGHRPANDAGRAPDRGPLHRRVRTGGRPRHRVAGPHRRARRDRRQAPPADAVRQGQPTAGDAPPRGHPRR